MMHVQIDLFRVPMARAPVMVAYGAGVDSTAMIIEMLARGEVIDIVLFADTGSEKPQTYAYLAMFTAWLAERGIPLVVVRYEAKDFKHYPPYRSLDENCFTNGTLPSISFGFSSCSEKWKIAPQNKWAESWEPAVAWWASGGKVIKCIGYDCSPQDAKRYAHAEGFKDDRYEYRYPLREWGFAREDCIARIEAEGLPVPVKSACFMCGAMKVWELDLLSPPQLRRIVLMEARAAPRLKKIEGLWRNGSKGTRGGEQKPGRMTDYIREHGLLPAEEVDDIWNNAPLALVAWQQAQAGIPITDRPELAKWMRLFDMRDAAMFDADAGHRLYSGVERLEGESDARK